MGIVSEPFPIANYGTSLATVTQEVQGSLIGLRGGDVVTGLVLYNTIAASGTAPTTGRFGLADSTGKILVLSGNINAAASWALGANQYAFTAPYTVLADGAYYACFVVNGTWSVTQPQPVYCTANASTLTTLGSNLIPAFKWTGQTDLPAVGASLTMTAVTVKFHYIGAY
jgi:hypothetical protein